MMARAHLKDTVTGIRKGIGMLFISLVQQIRQCFRRHIGFAGRIISSYPDSFSDTPSDRYPDAYSYADANAHRGTDANAHRGTDARTDAYAGAYADAASLGAVFPAGGRRSGGHRIRL